MTEPERALDEHQPVHAVISRSRIEQGRFPIPVVCSMGMAKNYRIGLPAFAFPLDRSETIMHAELVAVGDHHPCRAGLEESDAIDIKAAGHVNIAANAHHSNMFRNLHMKEVIDAIAAMDEAVKGIFPVYYAGKFHVVPMGIGDDH